MYGEHPNYVSFVIYCEICSSFSYFVDFLLIVKSMLVLTGLCKMKTFGCATNEESFYFYEDNQNTYIILRPSYLEFAIQRLSTFDE